MHSGQTSGSSYRFTVFLSRICIGSLAGGNTELRLKFMCYIKSILTRLIEGSSYQERELYLDFMSKDTRLAGIGHEKCWTRLL